MSDWKRTRGRPCYVVHECWHHRYALVEPGQEQRLVLIQLFCLLVASSNCVWSPSPLSVSGSLAIEQSCFPPFIVFRVSFLVVMMTAVPPALGGGGSGPVLLFPVTVLCDVVKILLLLLGLNYLVWIKWKPHSIFKFYSSLWKEKSNR